MTKPIPTDLFGPADDVFAALESVPGINDNLAERTEARQQMEQRGTRGRSGETF